MNGDNKPRLNTQVLNEQKIKTEVYRGLLVALGLGAIIFYFIAFPLPTLKEETVIQTSDDTDGEQMLRNGLTEYTHCQYSNAAPSGSVSWGHRNNNEGGNLLAFAQDNGSELKLWTAYPQNCTQGGYHFIRTVPGRGTENDVATYPIIGDTDGDGSSEIIVSSKDRVTAFTNSGGTLWTFDPETQYGDINYSKPILANWWPNHRGLETLVTSMSGSTLYIHRIKGNEPDRGTRIGIPITIQNVSNQNAVAISDIYYDYWPHIVIAADDYIHIYKKDGTLLVSFPSGSSAAHTAPVLMTGDVQEGYIFIGYNESSNTVIRGWHIYNYFTELRIEEISDNYPITVAGNMNIADGHTIAFANLTSNSMPDFAFATNSPNKLYGFTFMGESINEYPLEAAVTKPSQPFSVDSNNNGFDEIHIAHQPFIINTYDFQGGYMLPGQPLSLEIDGEGEGSPLLDNYTITHPPTVGIWNNQAHLSVPVRDGSANGKTLLYGWPNSSANVSYWSGVGGTMQHAFAYGFCDSTPYGECSNPYGSTATATYCNGGTFQSNCEMCGCPANYYCGSLGACVNENPPQGGSPIMLKAPQWYLDQMNDYCDTHPDDPLCQAMGY